MPADDDTITKLAEVIARRAWELLQDEEARPATWESDWMISFDDLGSYRDTLIDTKRPLARAVLDSGLVTPTHPLHHLAQQWHDQQWITRDRDGEDCATELTTLITRKDT